MLPLAAVASNPHVMSATNLSSSFPAACQPQQLGSFWASKSFKHRSCSMPFHYCHEYGCCKSCVLEDWLPKIGHSNHASRTFQSLQNAGVHWFQIHFTCCSPLQLQRKRIVENSNNPLPFIAPPFFSACSTYKQIKKIQECLPGYIHYYPGPWKTRVQTLGLI